MEKSRPLSLRALFDSINAWLLVAALGLFVMAGGCGNIPKEEEPVEIEVAQTTFAEDQDQAPFKLFREYLIQPGDVLDVLYHIDSHAEEGNFRLAVDYQVTVKFVHLPSLNETQIVRPDGTISLPYVGQVQVADMSVAELTSLLKEEYSKVLKNPELYVLVPSFRENINEFKRDLRTAPRGLSRLATVRPDGYATFAMIGDVFVADRTLPDVNGILNDFYKGVLPGLRVDLFLQETAGSRIYVLGEVNNPGAFSIQKPTSVLQALSLAGSALNHAKLSRILVIRRRHEKNLVDSYSKFQDQKARNQDSRAEGMFETADGWMVMDGQTAAQIPVEGGPHDKPSLLMARVVDLTKILKMEPDAEMFYLQPDDVVYVPMRQITNIAAICRDVGDILFFRGWSLGASAGYDLGGVDGTDSYNRD